MLAASELIAHSALPRALFVRLDLRHLVRGEQEVLCGTSCSRAADRGGRSPLPPKGFDPRGAPAGAPLQGAKKCPPEHPCGAKPRGGGGAPPTPLILLRNQRRGRRPGVSRHPRVLGGSDTPQTTPAEPASRGVRHRHARPAGPTHRDAPRRPRGASDPDSLRSRASRAHSARHDLPTRDGSLRFDQSARHRLRRVIATAWSQWGLSHSR